MTDLDFRDRILADLARLERKHDAHAKEFGDFRDAHVKELGGFRERVARLEERVAVRAALIGAGVTAIGLVARAVLAG